MLRKIIEIKQEDIKPLKMLAVLDGKDLKNYIQDLLTEKVKSQSLI